MRNLFSKIWNRILIFLELRKPPVPLVSMPGSLQQIAAHEHLEKETIITSPSFVYRLPPRKPQRFEEFSEAVQHNSKDRAIVKRRNRQQKNRLLSWRGAFHNVKY